MVLESNSKMQDLLREGLRKCGYRPLVISRPEIAIRRFEEDAKAAAGILVSTSELGEDALEVFNRFGHDLKTRKLPAILLLGAQHHDWHHRAKLADHRRVLEIPLRFGQLRKILTELMPPTETHATPATSNGGKPPAAATKQAGAKTSE
jgi:CheY-like chemotaxis protein